MYYHHQNYYYYNLNDAYRRHHPYQNPSYHNRHHHPYQNPSYNPHQNHSYHDQNYAYHRHQNPSYNPHQNHSYHDQNYAYNRHQNPSYYHQNCAYHRRRHQHHHQNPSYDQIPHHHHHHHHQQHRNRFYDQNLSCYNHHQQQQQHRNRFYDQNRSYNHHQIEALHCAASNPTRLFVAKEKPKPKEPVVVDFPVDVLILILARLPAKTLLKFRCVCKSWNSLILQDHHFISLHQLHLDNDKKKSPPLVSFHREGLRIILNYSSSSSVSTPYEIKSNRFKDPPQFITNSCNGLLGLYSSYSFFIVNPTIRKLRPLPRSTHECYLTSAALGFDASTGVYKVVRIFERYEAIMPIRFGCEVYYLGGRGGWKMIDDPPVQPSYGSLPAVVDGAILWASETEGNNNPEVVALSFDLREEKFSVILHPEGSSRGIQYCRESHVFASGGCICVAEERESPADTSVHMNIWLLMKEDDKKKNNSNKWVKQCVVDLTYVLEQMSPFCRAQPLTTDHNGRIVIAWGQGRKDYYDPRTGSFDKHELDATHVDVEHVAPYTESMVWPWPRLCGVQ